ncbi:YaiO family outer membrane beta-barrel protein, partial [Escherichia coli]|uniref:YaiO family outer membrane beta-barrel protein n=1 Tax=Escherichia coli TaxID=562 RepID=UPI00201037A5
SLTALTAEFTVGEGKLMTHDEPCSMAPDDKHDLISGTCSHLPYTHYDSSDAGGSYSNMISVRLNDPRGTGYTQLWLSRGTGAYTYDWTPETRYGSMKSVSLQRIQPLTEQLNLGLTAGKVWYDTPTDDYNGLQLAAHLTWKF